MKLSDQELKIIDDLTSSIENTIGTVAATCGYPAKDAVCGLARKYDKFKSLLGSSYKAERHKRQIAAAS